MKLTHVLLSVLVVAVSLGVEELFVFFFFWPSGVSHDGSVLQVHHILHFMTSCQRSSRLALIRHVTRLHQNRLMSHIRGTHQ